MVTIIVIILLLVISVFIIWKVPKWQIHAGKLDQLQNAWEIENEFRKTAAQVIGGIYVVVGIGITWSQLSATRDTLFLSQERFITERYSTAIEQLGSDKPQIRLGGIYSLAGIGRTNDEYRAVVLNVIAAFVREKAVKNSTAYEEIQTALNILTSSDFNCATDRSYTPLKISGAYLRNYNLDKSFFSYTQMNDSDFSTSNLVSARFKKTVAYNAYFYKSNLTSVAMDSSLCYGCTFTQAILSHSRLINCDFTESSFEEAILTEVDFSGSNLSLVEFDRANLEGADLSKAIGLRKQQLKNTITNEKTRLPNFDNNE